MKIAVIPARGGSERIPRKNIKPFCGKPLIAYSIDAARQSGVFDRIIVSSDDAEILEVSRRLGAETPFVRPAELSDARATTAAVMAHAVEALSSDGSVSAVCCLYATAPFVQPAALREGYELLQKHAAEYAISVTTFPFPIFRALRLDASGGLEMFWPEHLLTRSQDLPEAYHDAGQFYWGTHQAWRQQKPIFARHSLPIVLPRYLVQDIDTPEDWRQAELMYRAYARP